MVESSILLAMKPLIKMEGIMEIKEEKIISTKEKIHTKIVNIINFHRVKEYLKMLKVLFAMYSHFQMQLREWMKDKSFIGFCSKKGT